MSSGRLLDHSKSAIRRQAEGHTVAALFSGRLHRREEERAARILQLYAVQKSIDTV